MNRQMIVRTPALMLTVLAWGCSGTAPAIDDTGVAPTDMGAPTDTGVPPTDTGIPPTDAGASGEFFDATGMHDGVAFTVHCAPGTPRVLVGTIRGPGARGLLQMDCTGYFSAPRTPDITVSVGAIDASLGAHPTCSMRVSVAVDDQSGTGIVNCDSATTTRFSMDITEITSNADGSVTWAATFDMKASNAAGHSASATGSFRGTSRP